jgi:hypothetical protein
MRKTLTVAALAVALVVTTAAASIRPAELDSSITATKPYGAGKLTWLVFTAYDAALWTDSPQWSINAPFALTLRYQMSFTNDELVDRTLEEMHKIVPMASKAEADRYRGALVRAFPAVKSGDRITALRVPGAPVRFFHNGRPTAEIADAGFVEPFFGIWLSPKTAEPRLRAALLNLR